MVPAQQRLESADAPVSQGNNRLVVQLELVPLDRVAEVGLDEQALLGRHPHRGVEDLKARFAKLLGPVHRGVGVSKYVRGLLIPLGAQGDADADRDGDFAAVEVERLVRGGEEPVGDRLEIVRILDAVEQHRELVAPEPGEGAVTPETSHRVARPQGALQPFRQRHQQFVAGAVAQAVVDDLEAIDIDEEHRELRRCRRAIALNQRLEAIEKQQTIRETRQRVGSPGAEVRRMRASATG